MLLLAGCAPLAPDAAVRRLDSPGCHLLVLDEAPAGSRVLARVSADVPTDDERDDPRRPFEALALRACALHADALVADGSEILVAEPNQPRPFDPTVGMGTPADIQRNQPESRRRYFARAVRFAR